MMVVFNPNIETKEWEAVGINATAYLKNRLSVISTRLPIVFKCNGVKARFPVKDGERNILDTDEYILNIQPKSVEHRSALVLSIILDISLMGPVPRKIIWHSAYIYSDRLGGLSYFLKSKEEIDNESADRLLTFILGSLRGERIYEPTSPLVDFYGREIKFKARYHETGYAPLDSIDAVPYLKEKGRIAYGLYLTKEYPRAFAIAPNGSFGWASGGRNALDRALDFCNKKGEGECKIYSLGNTVVWIGEKKSEDSAPSPLH